MAASEPTSAATDDAADNPLTLNPLIGVRFGDLARGAMRVLGQAFVQPNVAAEYSFRFLGELARIAFAPAKEPIADKRFADTAFAEHPYYSRLGHGFRAWQKTALAWADAAFADRIERERARFIVELVTDALSPTNFLIGNPSALRKARETNGASLRNGARNLLGDLMNNHGMPSQVDKRAFTVGGNLANTPGAVVHRDDVLELIQYEAKPGSVGALPVLIVPPQVNKYYIYDLSPEKSFVRYLVEQGLAVYMISWRNPRAEQRDWTLERYVDSIDRAFDAALEVSGARAVHAVGACAGGITLATALGYFAGRGTLARAASLTLMVNVLQPRADDSVISLFSNDDGIEAARRRSARDGVLDGTDMARIFNWMRPNDLIWNYVVSNYLHGETPPAFDILYWNNDTTRLPARLHSDFLDLFKDDLLAKQGSLRIHDVPVDLRALAMPAFVTGGTTDHITPWQACYRSTQLLGGPVTFVLSTAGHIQSFINPPGSSKRKFFTNAATPPSADDWLAAADSHAGSWWPFWIEWLRARDGGTVAAPARLGSDAHPVLCPAPGTYVHE